MKNEIKTLAILLKGEELNLLEINYLLHLTKGEVIEGEEISNLVAKGFLEKDGKNMTTQAILFLNSFQRQYELTLDKVVSNPVAFESWWNKYPINDAFAHWAPTRTLRSNRALCERLYNQALKKGVTHEQLITALEREVLSRKRRSTDSNAMFYMPSSYKYLENEGYLGFLDANIETNSGFNSYGKDLL